MRRLALFALVALAGVSGFAMPPRAASGTFDATDPVVAALRVHGLPMRPTGSRHEFFGPRQRIFSNPGGNVVIWRFATERGARFAAAGVSKDGSTINSGSRVFAAEWVAPPHWYRRKRALVLFVGSDAPMLDALRRVLGTQFAGR